MQETKDEKFYMVCNDCGAFFLGNPGDKCLECGSKNTEPEQT